MPAFGFELEYAKSARSACKQCKEKIEKDALRIGLKVLVDAGSDDAEARKKAHAMESSKWHHEGCFPKIKGKAWFRQHLPEDLDSITGFDSLKEEDQEKVRLLLKSCRGEEVEQPEKVEETPKGSKRKADAEQKSTKKSKFFTNQENESSALSAAEQKSIETVKVELAKKNVAALGAMLAKNGLPKSGRKEELLDRVAEAKALGVPPSCPLCEKVKLRFSKVTGSYSCPGFFDDEAKHFKKCKGPGDGAQLARTSWQELGA
mmetsp:Transcript_16687/g.20483  ORF Transcript_16687/g.20483 Transcript_16687/m.20483 type:complete len:261 (+) Transcript_16687:37-819(+)|eukprot:CAMPEP_0114682528 /NCGR_PEP_ID=MMETSP0191-20121206/56667_1 /TAXON_ID=126664 /ORGANISM="Sorites sp." /LENGTH=260 /DNA_ID=CAMNT_0001962299 /DNA_START=37 /DNA_END=819 /DNA_ORIENTATION=-